MPYDKFAKRYDRALAPFEKRFLSTWRRESLSHLPENAFFLEIGAGTGLNFRHYPACRHAIAGEISSEMLALARKKVSGLNLSLVQTDGEKLPFDCDTFDAGLATLVFCSLHDPEKGFSELRRVVRNGGLVILLEHVRPDGILGFFFDFLNIFTAFLFEDRFNRRTADLAEQSGLKILEVKKKAFGIVNLIVCEVEK